MEYTYIVRNRAHLVGTEKRYPGDLIPEAAEWPNVRIYLDNKWIEKVPVEDAEVQAAMEKATAPEPAKPEVTRVELPRQAKPEVTRVELPRRLSLEEPAEVKPTKE